MSEVNLGTIYATLEVKAEQFNRALDDAKQSTAKMADSVSNFVGPMAGAFSGLNTTLVGLGRTFTSLPSMLLGAGLGALTIDTAKSALEMERLESTVLLMSKNLGVAIPEVDSFYQALGKVGLSGSKASQAIVDFLHDGVQAVQVPGKTSTQVMLDMAQAARDLGTVAGKDVNDAMGVMTTAIARGNPQILRQLGIAIQAKFELEDYAKSLGKTTSELNANEKAVYAYTIIMDNAKGVQGAWADSMDSGTGVMTMLSEGLLKLKETLGLAFSGALKTAGKELVKFMKDTEQWIADNDEAFYAFGQAVTNFAKTAVDWLKIFVDFIKNNGELVMGFLKFVAFTIAVMAANMVLAAWAPIAVAAAFTILFTELQKHPEVIQALIDIWKKIEPVLKAVWQTIIDVGTVILQTLKPAWDSLVEALMPIMPVIEMIAKFLGVVLVGAILLVVGAITGIIAVFGNLLVAAVEIFTGIIEFLTGFFQFVIGLFTGNQDLIKQGWDNMVTGLLTIIQGFITATLGSLATFFGTVIQFFLNLLEKLTGTLMPQIGTAIVEGFSKAVQAVKDTVNGWMKWISDEWFAMIELINSFGTKIKDAITKPFTDAWGEISKIAENIKGELDKINPFHRESPSLVDNVRTGVGLITDYYDQLNNLLMNGLQMQPIMATPVDGMAAPLTPALSNLTSAPTFNVTIGLYAGSEIEKRQVAKELNDAYQDYLAGRGQDVVG